MYLTEDRRHSSFVVKGLLDLEENGEIILKFKKLPILLHNRCEFSNGKFKFIKKGYPWCIELEIKSLSSNKIVRIGIDLQDWVNQFSYHSIKNCELIFKRATTKKSIGLINNYKKSFVKPFGPNCKATILDKRFLKITRLIFLRNLIIKGLLNPRKVIGKAMEWMKMKKSLKNNITKIVTLKNPPDMNYIFFQVQYHDWDSPLSEKINQYRATLIRLLKTEFKDQFCGGMWFENQIVPNYKDCLTNIDTDYSNYNRFLKNASIVISTEGFGNSIPWKLVEYMENGRCIVSQQNEHNFRYPIDNDTISNFKTPKECVELCKTLLNDNEKIIKMGDKSFSYYENNIKPRMVMKQILNESMGLA